MSHPYQILKEEKIILQQHHLLLVFLKNSNNIEYRTRDIPSLPSPLGLPYQVAEAECQCGFAARRRGPADATAKKTRINDTT